MKKILIVICTLFLCASLASCAKKFLVSFNTNGGSEVKSIEVKKNDTVEEPSKPTRNGYEFVEWQLDGKKFSFTTKITKNITLHAVWKKTNSGGNEEIKTSLEDWLNDGFYTYNEYISGTNDMCWNPLTWETTSDSYVLGYITMGFYDYVFNEDKTSYQVVCEMAEALPVDVTSKYVGRYGIAPGEVARAWEIALNKNAKWENGEDITSEDYIYSMKQQLDPEQLNRRADSYYGDFSIYNAKNYLYGNSEYVYVPLKDEGYTSVLDAQTKAGAVYINVYTLWNMKGGFDEQGNPCPEYLDITDTTLYYDPSFDLEDELDEFGNPVHDVDNDEAWISAADIYRQNKKQLEVGGSYEEYLAVRKTNENFGTSWDSVGLFADGDYKIVIVLEEPLENPTFYLPYHLSSCWLINETLYENCWKTQADKTVVNTYGTSVDTTMSYGPYKLTYFESDKQITFERNENWYGWSDSKHKDQYKTDKISCAVITKQETALLTFLSGGLDDVSLVADNMEKYKSSDYILYTPESYTTKFTINTDYKTLVKRETIGKINKRILTVPEFRKAISYCIDREYFASAFSSASTPGYGLLNTLYKVFDDNDLSESYSYRDFDEAKEAIVRLYGLTYGPGETYENLNEAYRAITGYSISDARKAMNEAYDYAVNTISVDDGRPLYVDGEKIVIRLSVYSNDTLYQQMFTYVRDQINEAAKGTPFEGKITLEMQVDADYYNSLYKGKTDMVFSTWGGAAYTTFSMLGSVYCDDSTGNGNQMELGFNTDEINITIPVKNKNFTFTLKEWADWLYQGNDKVELALGKASTFAYSERVAIFAELEYTYLSYFTAIPLYYRQAATLHSQKINYGSENYVELIGYGGIRYITYNYTDQEWTDYCQNNTLDYE